MHMHKGANIQHLTNEPNTALEFYMLVRKRSMAVKMLKQWWNALDTGIQTMRGEARGNRNKNNVEGRNAEIRR